MDIVIILSLICVGGWIGLYLAHKKFTGNIKAQNQYIDKRVDESSKTLINQSIELTNRELKLQGDIHDYQNNIQAWHQLYNKNISVLAKNKKILDKNEIILYHIKESAVLLYDHYNRVIDLLRAQDDHQDLELRYDKIDLLLTNAMNNVSTIETFFTNAFRIHPLDYQKSKINIIAKDPKGERPDMITGCGLN